MAKLPPFDEWKRPWQDGEFDAEKAAKLIYNLHKDKETRSERISSLEEENTELQSKVEDFETKDMAEVDKLKRKIEKLEAGDAPKGKQDKGTDDLRADRLEIALEKGLTKAQAARLVGSTREELEADADAYIEEHNLGGGENNGGKGGQAPPSNRPKARSAHRQGNDEPDPDEDTDPMELYKKTKGIA
jgi:hypothetical protein